MYKAVNHLLPEMFANYFTLNINVHHYHTRQSKNVHQDAIRTTLRKFSIKNYGSCLWNSLPKPIKILPSIHSFQVEYKKLLLAP